MKKRNDIWTSLWACGLASAALWLGCSTDTPTAPQRNPAGSVQVPGNIRPPDAAVGFSCQAAPAGFDAPGELTVSFVNESTAHFQGFTWQFGDGRTSRAENPTHTYSIGTRTEFRAALVASAAFGTDEVSRFVPAECG